MGATTRLVRWGAAKAARRLSRAGPWVGGAVALLTVASAIRQKGWVGGTLDTGLNAMPVVGAIKAAVESIRGRDLIPSSRRPANNSSSEAAAVRLEQGTTPATENLKVRLKPDTTAG